VPLFAIDAFLSDIAVLGVEFLNNVVRPPPLMSLRFLTTYSMHRRLATPTPVPKLIFEASAESLPPVPSLDPDGSGLSALTVLPPLWAQPRFAQRFRFCPLLEIPFHFRPGSRCRPPSGLSRFIRTI